MTDPITPPPELLDQWCMDATLGSWRDIATQAAQWGAYQKLEAMMARIEELPFPSGYADALRAACRPKPPSLKEQALALVTHDFSDQPCLSEEGYALIRRALLAHPTPQLVVVS